MGYATDAAVGVVHEFIGGALTIGDALKSVAEIATPAVGADMAGLTLLSTSGHPKTVSYTDQMVPEIDQSQYDSDRGPCLHAFRERRLVHVSDTGAESRWPEFAEVAMRHGIRTSLSVPIIVGALGVGAFNFYARALGTFDDRSAEVGTLYSRHAAILAAYYDRAEDADNLQRAMDSRATIEQAKGILMATTRCSADGAFDLLREQSQKENRRLRDIAAELTARQHRARR